MTFASWISAAKFSLCLLLLALCSLSYFYAAWGIIEWLVISRMKHGHRLQLISVATLTGLPLVFFGYVIYDCLITSNGRNMFLNLSCIRAVGTSYRSLRRRLREIYLNLRRGRSSRDGIYHALGPREIRIVNIAPGSGAEPIECELQHARLEDSASKYEALSYTWGRAYALRSIRLHGNHFHVTENLEGALRQLRLPNKTRKVWIDALSINQCDFEERGQQVILMRQIYTNAMEVFVWLGESTRTSNCAMDFLSQGSRQESAKQWFKSTILYSLSLYEHEWYAALVLFRRDYWKRVWIIQGVALAAKLCILCGSRAISWSVAIDCESAWRDIQQSGHPQHKKQMADVAGIFSLIRGMDPIGLLGNTSMTYDDLNNLNKIRLSLLAKSSSSKLEVLLRTHSSALATDPRDRIYALLGLASNCQDLPIDYHASKWEAYLQTMNFLLETSSSLDILSSPIGEFNFMGTLIFWAMRIRLPSWTPSFYWQMIDPRSDIQAESYIFAGSAPPFAASAYDRTRARYLAQTPNFLDRVLGTTQVTLQAQGCCVDRLNCGRLCVLRSGALNSTSPLFDAKTDLSSEEWVTWPPGHDDGKNFIGYSRGARWHINIMRKMYNHVIDSASFRDEASKEQKIEEFWRTIIFNRTVEGDEPPPEWRSMLSVIVGGPDNVPDDFISPTDSLSERAMAYVDPFMKSIYRLREYPHQISLTGGGRVCLTRSAHTGDRVCVIFGCNTPLLIRPHKQATQDTLFDRCTVIGPAYVHEYMYGKALEELDSGKLALHTFNIV